MKVLNKLFILTTLLFVVGISACDKDDDDGVIRLSTSDDESAIEAAFLGVQAGDVIEFAAGTYNLTKSLTIDGVSDFTIKGAGINSTKLNFTNQVVGAEGIKITNSSQFILANLTVEDTKGDAIKTTDCTNISFINVGTVWTGEASSDNGAYGLYPVLCEHVLIDGCVARGASDAGIYVGQSNMVIVKNSTAEMNVAGIEIENTGNADVFDNVANNNTAGILVFDLPGLSRYGGKTRIFNNQITNNKHENFASAGMVGEVPEGTGVMILATQQVEVFNNTITENNVMGVGIVNYDVLSEIDPKYKHDDPNFDSNPGRIYIHDNTFSRSDNIPDQTTTIGALLKAILFPSGGYPDIMYDGIDPPDASYTKCIQNNGDAVFMDVDVENLQNPSARNLSTDLAPYDCSIEALPEIVVDAPTL